MSEQTPRGNFNDKRAIANALERTAMDRFDRRILELFHSCPACDVLDLGCAEGLRSAEFAKARPTAQVVGLDLADDELQASWERIQLPNLRFISSDARELPFADGRFQLVTAIESLEHFDEPHAVMREIRRVCRGHLVASVPREPIWRALNAARGRHRAGRPLREWGDTPGHVNHWSRRQFKTFLREHGTVVALNSRLPWTVAKVRLF